MKIVLPPTPLYKWQSSALETWVGAGRQGIIASATGTGKTLLALHAISASCADRIVVVVPTQVLQDQWVGIFRTELRLSPRFLGRIGGPTPDFTLKHRVTVAVINSARRALQGVIEHWHSLGEKVFLIVDECHWAGSATSVDLFRERPDFALGLSATPERQDDGVDKLLVPNLGRIIFRYALRDAMDDGVLSEITAKHLFFDLSPSEQRRTNELIKQLRSVRDSVRPSVPPRSGFSYTLIAESVDKAVERALEDLHRVLGESGNRVKTAVAMATSGQLDGRRTIIFNQTIAQATRVARGLDGAGVPFAIEHSHLPISSRRSALERFASGSVPILIAVRALDEGVDVPDANTAIIVSGSLQVRQRIQRIGRIARASSTQADVITLLARNTPEHWEVSLSDAQLLGAHRVKEIEVAQGDVRRPPKASRRSSLMHG